MDFINTVSERGIYLGMDFEISIFYVNNNGPIHYGLFFAYYLFLSQDDILTL